MISGTLELAFSASFGASDDFRTPLLLPSGWNMESRASGTIRDLIRADGYRYSGSSDRSSLISTYIHQPGFRFSYHLRKVAHYGPRSRLGTSLLYAMHRIWLHVYRFRYGFDISPKTRIGPGLYIGHFGGVVISPDATLGSNVNIAQGVTIGATSRGSRLGAPTLQDRVWVGAHAIVVGKITIGNDALIAPGAYVNFDVPSQSVVLGNPGKIVSHKGSYGYINNILEDTHLKRDEDRQS
jgi:serine O-acetyltransferase